MASIKKGLVAIANEILEDVKKESEIIIRDAEKKAEEILTDAKTEAKEKRICRLAEAKEKGETEKKKTKSLTEIEIRNRLLQVKQEQVNAVFDKALARLKQFAESDSYHRYLLSFIEEAIKKIESEKLVVYVNSKDRKWLANGKLDELSKKLGIKLTLAKEIEDCLGGCIVKTPDGKLLHDNTFEKRLEALKPVLRGEVAKILFERRTEKFQ
jgi:V/A-type H+-transporting ATPase subunit E